MAKPRRLQATLELTPYLHCTSRCVRGSYLCGVDRNSGVDYTHRREWLRDRLIKLANCFSIKLAAFAIMENHFHVVLRVEKETAESWSEREVVKRWHTLFKGTQLSQRFIRSEHLTSSERKMLAMSIARWRSALSDISWFMRCSKEPLARRANKEDECTGRFWEGRFHSQALLDARAVITCMAYVDLNPVRAGLCKLPETDKYTSFHYREQSLTNSSTTTPAINSAMLPLSIRAADSTGFTSLVGLKQYVELVDATARQSRPDKKGFLCHSVQPILHRLGIHIKAWNTLESTYANKFHVLVGSTNKLNLACERLGQRVAWGQRACQIFFDYGDSDSELTNKRFEQTMTRIDSALTQVS